MEEQLKIGQILQVKENLNEEIVTPPMSEPQQKQFSTYPHLTNLRE
jgi:hypothetical protein